MTANAFRKLALSFPEALESSHHGHPDFRVGGKIFATLGYPDESFGVVMLTPDDQAFYVRKGTGFAPVNGEWGRQGSTLVELRTVTTSMVRGALEAAWQRRAPKRVLKAYLNDNG
jgi:hypothetical protein